MNSPDRCHGPVLLASIAAVVLVAERHARFAERKQPAVGDRNPVGVARQIRPARPRFAAKEEFGVDEPVLLPQWSQYGVERLAFGEVSEIAEELELPGRMGVVKSRQEEPPEQLREPRTGRKKPGLHDIHRSPLSEMPPPGTIIRTCG